MPMRTHYIVRDLRRPNNERLGMVTNAKILLGEIQYKVLWDDNKSEWVAAKHIIDDDDQQGNLESR